MKFNEWRALYKAISEDLGFSRARDLEAAILLRGLVHPLPMEVLKKKVYGKTVSVYGAGQSLEEVRDFPPQGKIAADGATSYLLERDALPEIVVTDLDGNTDDLLKAHSRGSIVVLHAHGDNMDRLRTYAPRFSSVVPTCQCRPPEGLYNFGGFTDGDRAVFMAVHLGARKVVLYGMDFKKVGKYSFSRDTPWKRKKLKWGKMLIDYLIEKKDIEIIEGEHG
jgi:hypothetical protein